MNPAHRGVVSAYGNAGRDEGHEETHCGNDEQNQMKDSHAPHSNGENDVTHDELVFHISRTIHQHRHDNFTNRELAIAILDTIEKPIRKDEREICAANAARAVLTDKDGVLTMAWDDPWDLGWTPITFQALQDAIVRINFCVDR